MSFMQCCLYATYFSLLTVARMGFAPIEPSVAVHRGALRISSACLIIFLCFHTFSLLIIAPDTDGCSLAGRKETRKSVTTGNFKC